MKIYSFIFIILVSATSGFTQSVLERADMHLLNAEYDQVLTLANNNTLTLGEPDKPLLQNKKAEALIRTGKFAEASTLLQLIEKHPDAFVSAVAKTNVGLLHIYQGRNDLALESLQQAINDFQKLNKNNSLEAAQAIAYLGQVYKFTGKHAQAEEQLLMALSIREKLLDQKHELIAASYNDLGLAYVEVDNDKALDYYEKALTIYQVIHGDHHPKIALTNSNIGLVYREMELYGDAVNNFENALGIWDKIYSGAHQAKAFTLHNLGQTYSRMGNVDAAQGYYKRAFEMYRQVNGSKHPDIAQVLNDYGYLELTAKKYDQALTLFQEAICANVIDFENKNPLTNPALENYYNGRVLLYSLLFKARGFESKHFGKSLKLSDLIISLDILHRCDSLIDHLRQQSTNESDKLALGAIATEVYTDGVRTAYEAAAVSLKKKPLLEKAFYFAEKSKSAVLLEAISESDAKSFAGIPQHLLDEEKALKSAIALAAQKLAQKPSIEEEKNLRATAFKLNRTYETFVKNLEKDFPGYFNLKYNAASPSIRQIQEILDDKTAMLSYFIDEENKRLYNFQITKSRFKVIDHAITENFDRNITGFRNGIFFNLPNVYAKASNGLSKILLPKIPASVKNIVIVPTGRLGIIPFEALSTKQIRNTETFDNTPYLIEDKSVRYEFSAGLLLQKEKQTSSRTPAILLCAPVTFPENENLNALPGSESEVKSISSLFAAKNITSTLFTHQEASEQAIKNASLKNYNLIHFATHGVVDENSPELSRIFFQSASAAEDGNLFAGEIYNLEMNADLVTLSACQTGLGKISKGEGVIGLSRALVYAGARNIMVSFWSVADESTSDLMKTFYQRVLENPSANYAENLQGAKRSLMKRKEYASPFYWAPFILIGF